MIDAIISYEINFSRELKEGKVFFHSIDKEGITEVIEIGALKAE